MCTAYFYSTSPVHSATVSPTHQFPAQTTSYGGASAHHEHQSVRLNHSSVHGLTKHVYSSTPTPQPEMPSKFSSPPSPGESLPDRSRGAFLHRQRTHDRNLPIRRVIASSIEDSLPINLPLHRRVHIADGSKMAPNAMHHSYHRGKIYGASNNPMYKRDEGKFRGSTKTTTSRCQRSSKGIFPPRAHRSHHSVQWRRMQVSWCRQKNQHCVRSRVAAHVPAGGLRCPKRAHEGWMSLCSCAPDDEETPLPSYMTGVFLARGAWILRDVLY